MPEAIRAGAQGGSDEPFHVTQFLATREAPQPNAADAYLDAFSDPDQLGPVGELGIVEQLRTRAAGDSAQLLNDIEQALELAEPVLERVDQAQSIRDCVFVTELHYDANLGHLLVARDVAQASLLELYTASVKQDPQLAMAAIQRALRLSRDIRPRGLFVAQLVSIAIDEMIADGVLQFFLNNPALTAGQCDRILELFIEHQELGLDRFKESVHIEYIAARWTIDSLEAGASVPEELPELPLEIVDYSNERQVCHRLFAAALRDARAPYHQTAAGGELARETDAVIAAVRRRSQGAAPIVMFAAVNVTAARDADARCAAHLAGLQLITAIRRFEVLHHTLPENAAVAIAGTPLPTVPIDPYSGNEMRFTVLDGRPTVYSVAKDSVDQGGQVDWQYGKQPGDYIFTLMPFSRIVSKGIPEADAEGEFRVWTSTVGSQLEAQFLRLVENDLVAVLKRRNGEELRVRLEQLSHADQVWIRDRKAAATHSRPTN